MPSGDPELWNSDLRRQLVETRLNLRQTLGNQTVVPDSSHHQTSIEFVAAFGRMANSPNPAPPGIPPAGPHPIITEIQAKQDTLQGETKSLQNNFTELSGQVTNLEDGMRSVNAVLENLNLSPGNLLAKQRANATIFDICGAPPIIDFNGSGKPG